MAASIEHTPGDDLEIPARFIANLVNDDYGVFKSILLATGKGRRPNLPSVGSTNRLVMQLIHLKKETGVSWDEVADLFSRLVTTVRKNEFYRIRIRCSKAALLCKPDGDEAFLDGAPAQPDLARHELHSIGVDRNLLLGSQEDLRALLKDQNLTNGLVYELVVFKDKQKLSWKRFFQWLDCFNVTFRGENQGKKAVNKAVSVYKSHQKSVNKSHIFHQQFMDFKSAQFCTPDHSQSVNPVPSALPNPPLCTPTREKSVNDSLNTSTTPLVRLGTELKSVKCQLETTKQELQTLKLKFSVLENEGQQKQKQIADLGMALQAKERDEQKLRAEKKKMSNELSGFEDELAKIRGSNYYKRLSRKETELNKCQQIIDAHSNNECEARVLVLKNNVKSLQSRISQQKKTIGEVREEQRKLKAAVVPLQREVDDYSARLEDLQKEKRELVTKVGNKYSDNVVKCIIQMIGEINIPANRCASAILCISKCLFDCDVDLADLPSERTNLRFADRGHVLAKYHVADSIINSEGFDLHSDGTTRDHRKYLGSQATLSTGNVMSMGYTMVRTEDTETLLDAAVALLQELADIYDDGNSIDENFKELLRKLQGLMSDRASVNKSYNKAMNKKRCDELGDESLQLEFVYCSAHFLLGLSSESEKIIKALQSEINGGKLGRDTLPRFKSWSSSGESAAARYIRTACDVLGPRGDDKNGCRDSWEAFCSLRDIHSTIKSYRSNRFNNYFEGAASLHYHRTDIEDFISNYFPTPNLKLQSVVADCQSDEIDTMLCSIGIVYFVLTGPYWKLVTSDTKYLDLYKYFVPMREKLVILAEDASSILEQPLSILPDFSVDGEEILPKLLNTGKKDMLQDCLQRLCKGYLAVTDRQLADFLPGGKYHDIQDQDRRKRMQHTQLTNLIGEQCLGDLDYSMFAKRHASLHYRSFSNMMGRNHTMSDWFQAKDENEQNRLLTLSAAKAEPLRKKHRELEKTVIKERKEYLAEGRRNLEKKREKVQEHKLSLSKKVKDHGGPCLVPTDVDKLVKRYKTKTAIKAALNDEIQYQKCVLGSKSKLLKSSKLSIDEIGMNLKTFLRGDGDLQEEEERIPNAVPDDESGLSDEEPNHDLEFETSDDNMEEESSTSNSEAESDLDLDSEAESSTNEETSGRGTKRKHDDMEQQEQFQFNKQGEFVAVFYSTNNGPKYYIGQVVNIHSKEVATVSYLQECAVKKDSFRWPSSADIEDKLNSKFVFHSGFESLTINGRTWTVPDIKIVKKKFRAYIQK